MVEPEVEGSPVKSEGWWIFVEPTEHGGNGSTGRGGVQAWRPEVELDQNGFQHYLGLWLCGGCGLWVCYGFRFIIHYGHGRGSCPAPLSKWWGGSKLLEHPLNKFGTFHGQVSLELLVKAGVAKKNSERAGVWVWHARSWKSLVWSLRERHSSQSKTHTAGMSIPCLILFNKHGVYTGQNSKHTLHLHIDNTE